ncbi:MAG: ATP-binding protein [Pseudomonadota bacterium]
MNLAEIAYLDIAVCDFVRDHMIDGHAVVIAEKSTLHIRWLNGAAAASLGAAGIGAVIDADVPLVDGSGARQLQAALARPLTEKRIAAARTSGLDSRLQQYALYPFIFEGRIIADYVVLAFDTEDSDASTEPFRQTLAGLAEDSAGAAITDHEGHSLGSTPAFTTAALSQPQLHALCTECAQEADRMVKRMVETSAGVFAIGVGRLADEPARFLVLCMPAEAQRAIEPAPRPTEQYNETQDFDEAPTESAVPPAPIDDAETMHSPSSEPLDEAEWSPEDLSTSPIRFVWKTDRSGVFIDISEDFARAVGPESADIVGASFDDVAQRMQLDPDGEITASLKRRDTWSGKSVLWPVQGTDMRVPIDLAALPYYDRDRNFEGYRGFGIARMADIMVGDVRSLEDTIPSWDTHDDPTDDEEHDPMVSESTEGGEIEDDPLQGEPPVLHSATITPFRRNDDLAFNTGENTQSNSPADDPDVEVTPLSQSEADAFARIRAELEPVANDGQASNDDEGLSSDNEPESSMAALGPDALQALPLPLLIVRDEEALYFNPAFTQLTGFVDVPSLNAHGVTALFDHAEPEKEGAIHIAAADGISRPVRSHLQRVPWSGGNAFMFAFELVEDAENQTARTIAGEVDADLSDTELEHLVEENAELRAILDTATDGVVTIDEHGDIRSMNSAATALFGYDADALIGQSFSILFAHESQKQVLDYVQAMGSNGVANVLNEGREVTGREAQGGELKLFMTLGRLAASRGLCAVLRDITSWKRSEQQLEEARVEAESASEMKSAFLAKVSHEIRTPLNAIIGFSEIMSEERFGPIGNEKYRDYLDDIKKSGRYVVDLVNDLLDISKIESGNQELQFESVSLNETAREVVDMLRPQANRARIIVRAAFDPDLPSVVADQRAAKQIMTNLLSNALRYTPEGGQVVVSTRYLSDGSITLRIRDNGVGMTSEELEGALRPFKQVGVDDEVKASGTGLGLPLTRAMVEANRAQFEITSTPGEGTDVEIKFPAPRVLAQ